MNAPARYAAPSPALHHLVYSSSTPVELPEAMLVELLRTSRVRNRAQNITGVLLYQSQSLEFLQVLEGAEAVVRDLYARIALDHRHYGLMMLGDGPIATRQFPGWSMGFVVPSPAQLTRLSGYLDPNQRPLAAALRPADPALLHLLQEFVRSAEVFL